MKQFFLIFSFFLISFLLGEGGERVWALEKENTPLNSSFELSEKNFQMENSPSSNSFYEDKLCPRVAVINTLMASPQLALDYRISNTLLFGPEIIWHLKSKENEEKILKGSPLSFSYYHNEFGVYFTKFLTSEVYDDSWILNAGPAYLNSTISDGRGHESKGDAFLFKTLGGYHWQWKTRFNLEVLGGLVFAYGKNKFSSNDIEFTDKKEFVDLDMKVAWGYLF